MGVCLISHVVIVLLVHGIKWYIIRECFTTFFVLLPCSLSAGWDVPLDNFWAFLIPRWLVDVERRFPMTEASDCSISDGLPRWGRVNCGEWQTSRTLTADRRRPGTIFCPVFEPCVGTRITLPEYRVWWCRKHTHTHTHAHRGFYNTYHNMQCNRQSSAETTFKQATCTMHWQQISYHSNTQAIK